MDINDFIGKNGAGSLVLSFFDWGYRAPKSAQAGTKRRLVREKAARQQRAKLYAATPDAPHPARQIIRASRRSTSKEAVAVDRRYSGKSNKRQTNWTWREDFAALTSAETVAP